jgi:hypothetical protein
MEGREEGSSALEKAKNSIVELCNYLPKNRLYHLLTNDMSGSFQVLQKEELLARLSKVQLSAAFRSFKEIRKRISEIKKRDEVKSMDVYYLSDFQEINFRHSNFEQDSTLSWNLISYSQINVDNLYIDSCWIQSPVNLLDVVVKVNFRMKNSGKEAVNKIPVRLLLNGKEIAVRAVDLAARQQKTFSLSFKANQTGMNRAVLQIDDYPVSFDNELNFSFDIRSKVKVLEIDESYNSNYYLKTLFGQDSLVEYHSVGKNTIAYDQLNQYHTIIINELMDMSSGLGSRLKEYVERGGNIVYLPSLKADHTDFCHLFDLARYSLPDTNRVRVSFIELHHPVFKDVFEKIPENPDLPIVYHYLPMKYAAASDAVSLIEMEQGNAFLLYYSRGRGNIFQFALPMQSRFSNFPKQALFVPVMYNMAIFRRQSQTSYFSIGYENNILLDGVYSGEKDPLKIKSVNDDFEYIPRMHRLEQGVSIQTGDRIKKAGFYEVLDSKKVYAVFGMNYDRKESEFSFMDQDAMRSFFDPEKNQNVKILSGIDKELTSSLMQENDKPEFWFWFIWLAIVFLILEAIVLRWMS